MATNDQDQSHIDPQQFQNLFDQMQNNQDFLQKMQGILAMQNYQITTESDENSQFPLQKSSMNRFSNITDDNQIHLLPHSYARAESAQNPQQTEFFDCTPNRTLTPSISYQLDSNNKNLFQEQFKSEEVFNQQQQPFLYQQQNFQSIPQTTQQFEPIDLNMITPEYLQMFNQFYQMFSQLQASHQMDLSSDPNLLQSMMVTFFTQMMQNQQIISGSTQNLYGYPEGPSSPRQRDYNNNLPLASIPESKESILEEASGWGTVKTNKFGALMSANSGFQKDYGCSCCINCIEQKKRGILQQCSNFNLGNQMMFHNSQLNQDTFIHKSDISSTATSQILNNPFGLGSLSPSPNHNIPYEVQSQYSNAANQVNQNLNQMFQIQFQGTFSNQEPQYNSSMYQSRKDSYQSNQNDHIPIMEQYLQQQQMQSPKQISGEYKMVEDLNQPEVLSPKQIQQNKLIEYMIDNNDFSNYKQRRQVIKGERMSRTLSRSGQSNSGVYLPQNNKQQLSLQSSIYQFNQSQIQQNVPPNNYQGEEFQQYFSDAKIQNKNMQDEYNQQHQYNLAEYNKETLQFFSPQITNKQQNYDFKNRFEDIGSDNQDAISPEGQRIDDQSKGKNNKRKKTQDKIKEIRKLNELQRGKDLIKKSQTRKNIHKQQAAVKSVFEIKDLKKSKSKNAGHLRKQSYNAAQNKENNKLTQSNYQNQYEMSHQQIMLSPNQDLLLISTDENTYQHNKKESDTFKSLNSVANGRVNNSKQVLRQDNSDEHSSPQITNLKLKINSLQTQNIIPFDSNNMMMKQQRSSGLDLNNILLQEENKKPGQEIHIIKKPVQTEELKKIQERLNKYYQDKRKEETEQRAVNSNKNNSKNNNYHNTNNNVNTNQFNDAEAMSMTKTLSSFKSLMMKTMSQMSIQQDNNIQQQYIQGKDQRSKQQYKTGANNGCNQSMNVSSIQDDYSVGGDYSENLTKIISPKNLYNGQLGSINQRNGQMHDNPNVECITNEKNTSRENTNENKKSQCLPNSLFFNKSKGHQKSLGEDTLSLKYNSRQPSLCYCGQQSCICDQNSKKDLLSHFQNFLQEMDKHPPFNSNGIPINRESIYHSPIANLGHSNSTHDFLMSNFQFLGMGRSSSQNSRLSRPTGGHSNRQNSITTMGAQIINQPKIKRFSSGALINLPLKKLNHNNQHSQSTQVLQNLKKISMDNDHDEIVVKRGKEISNNRVDDSPLKKMPTADQLEKLDTNKEEEIRLLTIENDIMHKAFIQKSHRLNLQEGQRNELLQRIQRYKQDQQSATARHNLGKSLQEENYYSNGAVGSTQNTSQATGLGISHNNSGGNSITEKHIRGQSDGATSLEERRKIEKYRKQAEKIMQAQSEREQEIQQDAEHLEFY